MTTVRLLKVEENELAGALPTELAAASNLQTLLCGVDTHFGSDEPPAKNKLEGPIPDALSSLRAMVKLSFTSIPLHQEVPRALAGMLNLQLLFMSTCDMFSDSIDVFLQLTSLQLLTVMRNYLHGSIPDGLAKLSDLVWMDLGLNMLIGSIPHGIQRLQRLSRCLARINALTGALPDALGALSNSLWHFGLARQMQLSEAHIRNFDAEIYTHREAASGVTLGGTLPDALCFLQKLGSFACGSLNFEGVLPECFGKLLALDGVHLNDNRLKGSITPLLRAQNLRFALLNLNSFSGSLPGECFESNRGLSMSWSGLRIKGNRLTGTLPEALLHITRLFCLEVSKNELAGPLPEHLFDLRFVSMLHLSYNLFEGTVPGAVEKLVALKSLDLRFLFLQGQVPRRIGLHLSAQLHSIALGGQLTGTLPESLGRLTHLETLVAAKSTLTGKIPDLQSTMGALILFSSKFQGPLPPRVGWLRVSISRPFPPVLHAAHNHLVCSLPVYQGLDSKHAIALLGNRFTFKASSRPQQWVNPMEQGGFFAHRDDEFSSTIRRFAVLFLLMLLSLLKLLADPDVVGCNHLSGLCCRLKVQSPLLYLRLTATSRFLLYAFGWSCLQIMANLLCGQEICSATLDLLAGNHTTTSSFQLLSIAFCSVRLAARLQMTLQSNGSARVQPHKVHRAKVVGMMWFVLVLLWSSLPASLYLVAGMVPGVLGTSELTAFILYNCVGFANAMCSKFVLQYVANKIASGRNIRLHSLLALGRMAATWLVPTIVILLLHHRCVGFWTHWWPPCYASAESSPLSATFYIGFPSPNEDYRKRLVCVPNEWTQIVGSQCALGLHEKLGRLLIGKLEWLYLVPPTIYLMSGHQGASTDVTISGAVCTSLIELAFVFTPLVPYLMPLILLGYALHYISVMKAFMMGVKSENRMQEWPQFLSAMILTVGFFMHTLQVSDSHWAVAVMMLQLIRIWISTTPLIRTDRCKRRLKRRVTACLHRLTPRWCDNNSDRLDLETQGTLETSD